MRRCAKLHIIVTKVDSETYPSIEAIEVFSRWFLNFLRLAKLYIIINDSHATRLTKFSFKTKDFRTVNFTYWGIHSIMNVSATLSFQLSVQRIIFGYNYFLPSIIIYFFSKCSKSNRFLLLFWYCHSGWGCLHYETATIISYRLIMTEAYDLPTSTQTESNLLMNSIWTTYNINILIQKSVLIIISRTSTAIRTILS